MSCAQASPAKGRDGLWGREWSPSCRVPRRRRLKDAMGSGDENAQSDGKRQGGAGVRGIVRVTSRLSIRSRFNRAERFPQHHLETERLFHFTLIQIRIIWPSRMIICLK